MPHDRGIDFTGVSKKDLARWATRPLAPPREDNDIEEEEERPSPRIQCLADVKRQPVRWLWPGRLARGKIGLLSGDPGVCKSYLTISVASAVSRGAPLPGSNDASGPPGRVLIVSYEDDSGDTISPRAEAAGANMRNIDVLHLGTQGFSIPADLPELKRHIREHEYTLVIIDPLGAALSGAINSYVDAEIRRALAPVHQLAAETGAAILVIRHLVKKAGGRAINLGGGSIGITGAARVELLMAKDEHDPAIRVLAVVKCNMAAEAPSLSFRLAPSTVPDLGDYAVLQYLGTVSTTADDIAAARAAADGEGGQEQRAKLDEAAESLRDLCASAPIDRREVERWGKANGYPMRTLDRARQRAGVVTRSVGFGKDKRSEWYLEGDGSGSSIPAKGSSGTSELPRDSANPAIPAKSPHTGGLGANGANDGAERPLELVRSANGTGPHPEYTDIPGPRP
jgi:hypothetical protein